MAPAASLNVVGDSVALYMSVAVMAVSLISAGIVVASYLGVIPILF